jgi:hypothetical protein
MICGRAAIATMDLCRSQIIHIGHLCSKDYCLCQFEEQRRGFLVSI